MTNYPGADRAPITEPLGEPFGYGGSPFTALYFDGVKYTDGVEYLTARLVALGWVDGNDSHSARTWAKELLRRYPALTSDEHDMAPEIVDRLADTIPDPHDWDSHGSVINVLQWFWESM